MRAVLKYPIAVSERFTINLPRGAEALSVAAQYNNPVLWALVDGRCVGTEARNFVTAVTGGHVHEDAGRFIGTLMLDQGAFVLHVFESIVAQQARTGSGADP